MGSPMVRPLQLVPDDPPRLLKRLEYLLSDTLFVETPKEPLTDPVLFWDRGGDELLLQTVVATGSPEAPTLKDESIVAVYDRRAHRCRYPQGRILRNHLPEPFDPGRVHGRFSSGRARQPMLTPCGSRLRPGSSVAPRHRPSRPHASDVFRSKGYGFNAFRKMSLPSTSSPIFCLSF